MNGGMMIPFGLTHGIIWKQNAAMILFTAWRQGVIQGGQNYSSWRLRNRLKHSVILPKVLQLVVFTQIQRIISENEIILSSFQ